MKKLLITLLAAFQVQAATTEIIVEWEYPLTELSAAHSFTVWQTTNVVSPSWSAMTNVVTTVVPPSGTNGVNAVFSVVLPVEKKQQAFAVSAANFWGSGPFSAATVVPAPPLATSGRVTIRLK